MVDGVGNPLVDIVTAPAEDDARSALLREISALGGPAACLLWGDSGFGGLTQRMRPLWFDMRHNRQTPHPDFDPDDYITQKAHTVPTALLRLIVQRDRPVRLSELAGFFPRFARSLLHGADEYGLEPLKDVVGVPFWQNNQYEMLAVGFLEYPTQETMIRLSSVGLAYLSRWQNDLRALAGALPVPIRERLTLTAQELDCLRWAVAGKTLQDIADLTGLRYRTVRHVLDRVRDRYGYATYQQTIARAAIDYGFDPMGGTGTAPSSVSRSVSPL